MAMAGNGALLAAVRRFEAAMDPGSEEQAEQLRAMKREMAKLEQARGEWSAPRTERNWNEGANAEAEKAFGDPRKDKDYQEYKAFKAEQAKFDQAKAAAHQAGGAPRLPQDTSDARARQARDAYFKLRGLEFDD